MNSQTEKIRQLAQDLLQSQQVATVIGFKRGTEAHRSAPAFVAKPEDCDELIFDCTCTQNLANYVRKRQGKTGVVVKGCDARAISVLCNENQLKRDDLYIIGVPCEGLVDPDKLAQAEGVRLADLTEVAIEGEQVVVKMGDQEVRLPSGEVLRDECLGCQCPTPVVHDELVGEEIGPRDEAKFRELSDKIDAMTPEEREQYFQEQFEKCIRCFACVKSCPMCYCTTCFAIQDKPQYVTRMVGLDENRMFHLGRAMHLAGRCVACGACDRACPVGISLRALNSKLAAETKDLFACVAGFDCGKQAPLLEFLPGDTEEALDTH
jgi:ferredoxin